jgi:hypothetical protein
MTPAAPPAGKKKLSPLAWVAIGCGVILVIGAIIVVGMVGAGAWFAKKQIAKFEENPAVAAAELAVRANPDLEVVESDPEAGTLTVRNKKTGEVVTWNAKDIEEGRFSITTSGGEATFETGGEEGSFKITNEKGEEITFSGLGDTKDLPSWLPAYPGGKVEGSYDATTGEGRTAAFTVTTSDPAERVLAYYDTSLQSSGLTVQKTSYESDGKVAGGTVTATGSDGKRTVNIMVSAGDDGQTTAVVTFGEKP